MSRRGAYTYYKHFTLEDLKRLQEMYNTNFNYMLEAHQGHLKETTLLHEGLAKIEHILFEIDTIMHNSTKIKKAHNIRLQKMAKEPAPLC